jgi:hypothetical protein
MLYWRRRMLGNTPGNLLEMRRELIKRAGIVGLKVAKSAQRAKKVKVRFKPLLAVLLG